MRVTWNLSPNLSKYKQADALILSVGKSGRTWLRVLLNKYLSLHYDLPFGVGDLSEHDAKVPTIRFDHEMWSHYCDAKLIHRLLGSNIVPHKVLWQKQVVVVYRDPRDVVVSLHFHKTKRSRRRMEVDISTFIRDPNYGVANIVRVMNLWRERLDGHPRCHWMRYESMKADTRAELRRMLDFLAIPKVSDDLVNQAVEFSEFENMKKMEAKNEFGSAILSARNVDDPDSYKVREGSVGGYLKHFDADDLAYLDREISKLDPFFGYKASSPAS